MDKITTSSTREIIEDFAKEINARKKRGPKPAKCVINFRRERVDGKEREIYYVPLELLRYRKDNGRICSDVLNYEKSHGYLDEKSKSDQGIIEGFLKSKDVEKTRELYNIIEHDGQLEPAIITCDGFLINGNRRKMVLESLCKVHRGDPKFTDMKVVILPGKDDEGGPPTLLEIEQIENRYQLQSEGKAEYYAFDRALSMRRKILFGMSLEEQLGDDPNYAGLKDRRFNEAVKKIEREYIKPLECIDRYLLLINRDGLYSSVSKGLGDPEGRWQAFRDYYNIVYQKLEDDKKRIKLGINENEVGELEDAAFKIIRMRELGDLGKVHKIMRDMGKWLGNENARRELIKLKKVEMSLPKSNININEDGDSGVSIDKVWTKYNASEIIKQVKKAKNLYEFRKEKDTPMDLLEAARNRLRSENMILENMDTADYQRAMQITREIQKLASDIEGELYELNKKLKRFVKH